MHAIQPTSTDAFVQRLCMKAAHSERKPATKYEFLTRRAARRDRIHAVRVARCKFGYLVEGREL